jgi:hypothetical protein
MHWKLFPSKFKRGVDLVGTRQNPYIANALDDVKLGPYEAAIDSFCNSARSEGT